MKEYKCIETYVGEQFNKDIAPLAAQGWRLVHVYSSEHYVTVILERDKEEETTAATPQVSTEELELLENIARKICDIGGHYTNTGELAEYALQIIGSIKRRFEKEKENEN